jgi:hypothetical protein
MGADKKLTVYYNPPSADSSVYAKKTIHTKPDGTSFDSVETHKQYYLYDKKGVKRGEAIFYEHKTNNILTMFHDCFKLYHESGVNQQYQVVSVNEVSRPLMKKLGLTQTLGNPSFNRVKWVWPAEKDVSQKRTLTFSIKKT